jgi:predicted phage replisome organizer/uncharacterized phage protein (TIGR02220 family)
MQETDNMKVSWIKLDTGFFKDDKIQMLEASEGGEISALMFLRLLCMAGEQNDNGNISLSADIPHNDQSLAIALKKDELDVAIYLEPLIRFKMIEYVPDEHLKIVNYEKHQDTGKMKNAERQKRYRERQKNDESINNDVTEILNFMNKTLEMKKGFGVDTESHRKDISARLKEIKNDPDRVQLCKNIVLMKKEEWFKDPKSRTWLRPSTLFRKSNFANYLVELENWKGSTASSVPMSGQVLVRVNSSGETKPISKARYENADPGIYTLIQ